MKIKNIGWGDVGVWILLLVILGLVVAGAVLFINEYVELRECKKIIRDEIKDFCYSDGFENTTIRFDPDMFWCEKMDNNILYRRKHSFDYNMKNYECKWYLIEDVE